MISNDYTRLPLSAISVLRDERQRRSVDLDKGGLLSSIRKRGVQQPIIVRRASEDGGKCELVVGERRYTCSLTLALPDIPVRFTDELDPIELKIVELEENIHRVNLTWQDFVRSVSDIHDCYKAKNPGQTMTETGEATGITEGTISMYCAIAGELEDEVIARAGTAREAYNILSRRRQRLHGDILEEILAVGDEETRDEAELEQLKRVLDSGPPFIVNPDNAEAFSSADLTPGAAVQVIIGSEGVTHSIVPLRRLLPLPPSTVLCENFLTWAPSYKGKKFNLIHCDFPYGVGVFSGDGSRTAGDVGLGRVSQMGRDELAPTYDDSAEVYQQLVETLCVNLPSLLSVSGHLVFWFSNRWDIEQWTRAKFAELCPDLKFSRFPLIWFKSDNAGIAAVPTMEPRHVYETALLASRGGRQVVKLVADCYAAPTQRSSGVTIKPSNVLRHFFSMLIDEHTRLLDPTCGSGSALVAAEGLGAGMVLGLELDESRARQARTNVETERRKRVAAEASGGDKLSEIFDQEAM